MNKTYELSEFEKVLLIRGLTVLKQAAKIEAELIASDTKKVPIVSPEYTVRAIDDLMNRLNDF
jgi:hypothetical protein